MTKNYSDFIDSLTESDMKDISTKASKALNERISSKEEDDYIYGVMTKSSFFISLYLLEKYHEWLNKDV